MSDENAPADREHFGEASLGEAEAESNPDPNDESDPYPPDEELADVPALDPVPTDETEDEAETAAAAEAGAIGGDTGMGDVPESQRAVVEGGEGEAEGFELAEEELIESATHGEGSGSPLGDRFTPEEAESEGLSSYGEPDQEHVSEDRGDDHS